MSQHLRDQWRKAASLTASQMATVEAIREEHSTERQRGVCGRVSAEVEKALGFPKVDGLYTGQGMYVLHAWNLLPDGRVLDATADQFGLDAILISDGQGYEPFTPEQQRFREEYREENFGRDPDVYDYALGVEAALNAVSTLWHVTDRPGFTIDPAHQPGGANGEVGIYGAGLFVTPNPELWHYLWRPQSEAGIYAAEVDAPPSVVQWLGIPGDDRDQGFIAAKDLSQVTIRRVVPIQQAEAEANAEGYGFAMIATDVIERTRICVIDHKAGWGNPMALCERITDGNPIKWTTTAWVKDGPITDRICPDCLEALR